MEFTGLAGLKITIYIEKAEPGDKAAPPATSQRQTGDAEMSSKAQQNAIYAAAHSAGWKDYEIEACLDKNYGTPKTSQLTKKEASEVIDKINKGTFG